MKRKIPLQVTALSGAPVSAASMAQGDPGYYDHMMGWGSGMFWGPFAWIFWLGLVVIVVLLVLRLVGGNDNKSDKQEDEALQILRNRYARGEIDKEEYDKMRRELER